VEAKRNFIENGQEIVILGFSGPMKPEHEQQGACEECGRQVWQTPTFGPISGKHWSERKFSRRILHHFACFANL
jgi:hypothetical protein